MFRAIASLGHKKSGTKENYQVGWPHLPPGNYSQGHFGFNNKGRLSYVVPIIVSNILKVGQGEGSCRIHHLINRGAWSKESLLLSLRYIQCLQILCPNAIEVFKDDYRLFTICFVIANKFLDDKTYTNRAWASITGIRNDDLNKMEIGVLFTIDFNIVISEKEFKLWEHYIETAWRFPTII